MRLRLTVVLRWLFFLYFRANNPIQAPNALIILAQTKKMNKWGYMLHESENASHKNKSESRRNAEKFDLN